MKRKSTKGKVTGTKTVKPVEEVKLESPAPVLLAVTGMSPSIITETVWALANGSEQVIPARVIAVTTTSGRERIEKQLFTPVARFGGKTAWDVLRDALEKKGINLGNNLRFGTTSDDIRVITSCKAGGRSEELQDIRNGRDNEATADFLLDQVRSIVENPDRPLIASIAGGRKTMGALLYACMTLIGREGDRLTHVLVSEPFETMSEFYFPGQPGGALQDHRSRMEYDPSKAEVELADIPFVALRNLFYRELGRRPGGFMNMVEYCRESVQMRATEDINLIVHRTTPQIEVNGRTLNLSPREQAMMLFLAERAKNGKPAISKYKIALDLINDYRESLKAEANADDFSDWRRSLTRIQDNEDDEIRKILTDLRRKLSGLGETGHRVAECLPQRGRFSLNLPADRIQIK